jgi:hypothetical protein
LIFAGKRGHHDNFNVFCFGCGTEDIEHVETADFWHHNVANDKGRTFFNCHSKCRLAVASRDDVVAFGEQTYAVDFAQALIILYQ